MPLINHNNKSASSVAQPDKRSDGHLPVIDETITNAEASPPSCDNDR